MRYRIYLKASVQIEVECSDIRVTGHRRIKTSLIELHPSAEKTIDIDSFL